MFAAQDAKREILVNAGNCDDLGGCRWLMIKRQWTVEDS